MAITEANNEYVLKIDFQKDSENPSRVFLCLAELIKAFSDFDNSLLVESGFEVKAEVFLKDIESGSIKTFLYSKIKNIDDKDIEDLKWQRIVGSILLEVKYKILEYLDKNEKFESLGDLQILTNKIDEIMVSENALFIPLRTNPMTVAKGIKSLQNSLSRLSKSDRAFLLAPDKEIEINKDFYIPDDIENEFFTKEIKPSTPDMVLQIKKPDYLGDSQWQFRVKDQPAFYAKISDRQWLSDFHNRKIDLRPGDSIKAKVRIETYINHENVIMEQKYEILAVERVIQDIAEKQMIIHEIDGVPNE